MEQQGQQQGQEDWVHLKEEVVILCNKSSFVPVKDVTQSKQKNDGFCMMCRPEASAEILQAFSQRLFSSLFNIQDV